MDRPEDKLEVVPPEEAVEVEVEDAALPDEEDLIEEGEEFEVEEEAADDETAAEMEAAEEEFDDASAAEDAEEAQETEELDASFDDPVAEEAAATTSSDGYHGWTIVLVCLGIGLIAACMIIPQADQNGRMLHQVEKLRIDLEHLERQVSINDEFIQRAGHDAVLSERLAQRQLKLIRKGTAVLEMNEPRVMDSSPFSLTMIQAPPPMPEYEPVGGRLGEWCRDDRKRLYTIGTGLFLLAAGLVLGSSPTPVCALESGGDGDDSAPA